MFIDEKSLLETLSKAKKVVLLEPVNLRKYVPLGLAKISTYIKQYGGITVFQRKYTPCGEDLVCITSLFTWNSKQVHAAIDDVFKFYIFGDIPKILVGGVYIALMPEYVNGLYPNVSFFKGCSQILDECKPDYSIDYGIDKKWNDISYIYTSRGCPNRCKYCSAWKIEPERYQIKNWKEHIDLSKSEVMINDNNLSSQPIEFIKEIFDFISSNGKKLNIKNGFDCKYITNELATMLGKMKFSNFGMKLSFDRISEDGVFQEAVRKLLKAGVPKNKIMVYVLYNFNETPKEAIYRATECIKLKVTPYPQQYTTMTKLNIHDKYLGKYWTPNLRDAYHFFYLFGGYYRNMTFYNWCKNTGQKNNNKIFTKEELDLIKE